MNLTASFLSPGIFPGGEAVFKGGADMVIPLPSADKLAKSASGLRAACGGKGERVCGVLQGHT